MGTVIISLKTDKLQQAGYSLLPNPEWSALSQLWENTAAGRRVEVYNGIERVEFSVPIPITGWKVIKRLGYDTQQDVFDEALQELGWL